MRARQGYRRRKFRCHEKVFGRHRAEIRSITGVYKREASAMSNRVEKVSADRCVRDAEGRRPRILVAKIGMTATTAVRSVASAFADVGFDVDIGPLFATADERRGRLERRAYLGFRRWRRRISPAVPALKAALKETGPRRHHDHSSAAWPPAGLRCACTRPAPKRSSRRAPYIGRRETDPQAQCQARA